MNESKQHQAQSKTGRIFCIKLYRTISHNKNQCLIDTTEILRRIYRNKSAFYLTPTTTAPPSNSNLLSHLWIQLNNFFGGRLFVSQNQSNQSAISNPNLLFIYYKQSLTSIRRRHPTNKYHINTAIEYYLHVFNIFEKILSHRLHMFFSSMPEFLTFSPLVFLVEDSASFGD